MLIPVSNRVLVVDGLKMNQKMIQAELLKDFKGLQVDVASSGEEALLLIHEHYYNLIFLELYMKGMSGYETLRAIKFDMKLNVPIILLSIESLEAQMSGLKKIGVTDFIVKPVDSDIVRKQVEFHLLARNARFEEADAIIALYDMSISGINLREGLANHQNNYQIYIDLLRNYYGQYSNFTETFSLVYESGINDSVMYIRCLKEDSEHLGVQEVYWHAYHVELELSDRGTSDQLVSLMKSIQDVMKNIKCFLNDEEMRHTQNLETLHFLAEENLIALKFYLERKRAYKVKSILAKLLAEVQDPTFLEIADRIKRYDYTMAIELIDQYTLSKQN